jgi:hypothetical protein
VNAPLIQHSAASVEWYTPADIIERARRVLGSIDLDPASCAEANETVKARHYYNQADDGLSLSWNLPITTSWDCPDGDGGGPANVWLNPPGGKYDEKTLRRIDKGPGLSSSAVWWAKLWYEWNAGNVRAGIFLAFQLGVFQNSQRFEQVPPPQSFPFVVPKKRIQFVGPDGKPAGAATHPNAIILVSQDGRLEEKFDREFSELGFVVFPKRR